MYQWTHIEQSRQQQNGPKKEFTERSETHTFQEINKENNCKILTMASNGCEDSFASVKNKLLSNELNGIIESNSHQNPNEMNLRDVVDCVKDGIEPMLIIDESHNLENGKINCDSSLAKKFIETSTQTEETIDLASLNQSLATLNGAAPPPPPPPPPPLPFFIFNSPASSSTSNDKFIPTDTASQQMSASPQISHNNSQNVPPTTILSSASSFCIPPPPPMNGIPGPPPLPLPTGSMWFKSDSK